MVARSGRAVGDAGYAMVALLVGLSIMAVALSVALPTWSTMAKREREAELIFRGEQYARAIALYQRKYANAFPPNLDVLVDQKFLRKKYKDPMTESGEFQPVYAGQAVAGQVDGVDRITVRANQNPAGGLTTHVQQPQGRGLGGGVNVNLMGVVSRSTATSLRLYNGRNKYSEWAFVATQASTAAGARGGAQTPGPDAARGRRGRPGGPPPSPPRGRGF